MSKNDLSKVSTRSKRTGANFNRIRIHKHTKKNTHNRKAIVASLGIENGDDTLINIINYNIIVILFK